MNTKEKMKKELSDFFVNEIASMFNNKFTRDSVIHYIMDNYRNAEDIDKLVVECNEHNNTDAVIDDNAFVCDVYTKLKNESQLTLLTFRLERGGVTYQEVLGKFND